MIDHHQSPEDFATITFSDTRYAATCELIYDIICGLGEEAKIDEAIAQNLYTGLTTDTGFFAFSNTTANVHKVAGGLLNKGVSPEYIQDKVFNIFREERLRYYGYCFLNKLHVCHEGKVAYMSVNREEAKRFHLQPGDNESLVNFPFKVEGVMVSVLFTEEQDKVKISFRSKGKIDVNAFARKHFEGGGHVNAAGGKSLLSLTDTETKFLQEVKTLICLAYFRMNHSDKLHIQYLVFVLKQLGLDHVVLSPGSRSAPLVQEFACYPEIKKHVLFDERCAGYFALGLAQQIRKPVAVFCTSGTAVLNLAPAICEAYHQKVPLIVLTADRPAEAMGKGENQTINQIDIYKNYH
jgi:hypothetical protein